MFSTFLSSLWNQFPLRKTKFSIFYCKTSSSPCSSADGGWRHSPLRVRPGFRKFRIRPSRPLLFVVLSYSTGFQFLFWLSIDLLSWLRHKCIMETFLNSRFLKKNEWPTKSGYFWVKNKITIVSVNYCVTIFVTTIFVVSTLLCEFQKNRAPHGLTTFTWLLRINSYLLFSFSFLSLDLPHVERLIVSDLPTFQEKFGNNFS